MKQSYFFYIQSKNYLSSMLNFIFQNDALISGENHLIEKKTNMQVNNVIAFIFFILTYQ